MFARCFSCFFPDLPEIRANKGRDYPWEIYTLKEILHATNNFHDENKIGEGGYGSVYWVKQVKASGQIAVKRLKAMTAKAEMDFAVEVEVLGRARHKNLLGLRGFYAGGDERLIVYDYMPNHSLSVHLHGQQDDDCLLDWPRRMRIAAGSADGLALKGQYDQKQLETTVLIAMRCADACPDKRPSMMEVADWLKGGTARRKKEVQLLQDKIEEDEQEERSYGKEYEG
ncbi:unnamed protein product [Thlaspi arvense]|uniref:Protein kinase domain-containing protein n=1 Tax=Thlaspi arvense TaxID=13288 RepID=A0AAU9RG27_THLAR|nr:unnamed protein product [Thlaspi arvense]